MDHFSDIDRLRNASGSLVEVKEAISRRLSEVIGEGVPRRVWLATVIEGAPSDGHVIHMPRLILPLQGCFTCRTGDGHFELPAGQALLAAPGAWLVWDYRQPGSLLSISPTVSHVRFVWFFRFGDGQRHDPPQLGVWHHAAAPPPMVHALLEALLQPQPDDTRAALTLALMTLCRDCLDSESPPVSAAAATFQRAVAFVMDHLHRDIGRAEVARAVGVHPDHLGRLFDRFAGEGFARFVNRQRMEHAARLLETAQMPVKRVASLCGFRQSAYFIRRFREHFGKTPARYRQS
jgi:AraC-like DNA-binding protein